LGRLPEKQTVIKGFQMARPRKQAVVPAAAAPVAAEPLVPNGAVAAQQPPLAAIKKATEHLDDGKRELWLIQLPRNVSAQLANRP
jgi:hypothetical protein